MLGAIIGDIAGSRFEFDSTNDYNFEFINSECDFTDDTICTIAIADAINRGRDYGETMHEWCRKYPCPMGYYGGSFAAWVRSNNPQPYGSYGNGSAMRVSPIAYAFTDLKKVLEEAAWSAACTHNHLEGIKGAMTVAMAIRLALDYSLDHYQSAVFHIDEILQKCVEFSGYDINMPKSSVLNHFDDTCQGTVPVALKIISMARSYEDAVRMAVCLGTDADTLGAIVGSIAEAIWGIPGELKDKVIDTLLPEDMKEVYEQFFAPGVRSNKMLTDSTFCRSGSSDASWDMLHEISSEDCLYLDDRVVKRKQEMLRLMQERAKAREQW